MGIPSPKTDFHKPHSHFYQPAREKAALGKTVVPIFRTRSTWFTLDVKGLQIFTLHEINGLIIQAVIGLHIRGLIRLMKLLVQNVCNSEALGKIFLTHRIRPFRILKTLIGPPQRDSLELGAEETSRGILGVGSNRNKPGKSRILAPLVPDDP